jgi:hypothetical protein
VIKSINSGNSEKLIIEADSFSLKGKGIQLVTSPQKEWLFDFNHQMLTADAKIGKIAGSVEITKALQSGIQVEKEIFSSADHKYCAVRFVLTNQSANAIKVNKIKPLTITNGDDLTIANCDFKDYRMLKIARHKNDTSTCFIPSILDENFEDAAISRNAIVAGMGVTSKANRGKNINMHRVDCEPCFMLKNRHDKSSGLAMCVLGQIDHFSNIAVEFSDNHDSIKKLTVEYELDDIQLAPGAEFKTHWLLFFEANNETKMLNTYADIVADEFHLAPPKKSKTVYCTWYFFCKSFMPQHLIDNLAVIKERTIPLDAFVIDNGWMDSYGTWEPNSLWPDGMAWAAAKIKAAGIEPGIWTAPFIFQVSSQLATEHPEFICLEKDRKTPALFSTNDGDCYILDPSTKESEAYITNLFKKLADWGFTYHKLDWLRALVNNENISFRDPTLNRARAYRKIMSLIRKALGNDAYIIGCGGVFDAINFGVVDAYRSTQDVRSRWNEPDGERDAGTLPKIKQNVMRNYNNRFWHTDPDCTMIRIRETPFFEDEELDNRSYLSLGLFNDDEAFTTIVNQYLGGGNASICEHFPELQDERYALLRHLVPIVVPPTTPLDLNNRECPSLFITDIQQPRCPELGAYQTLACGNWSDNRKVKQIELSQIPLLKGVTQYAIFEFKTQCYLGLFDATSILELEIPAHGMRVLRIQPFVGKPIIVGTDCNLSGGAAEITTLQIADNEISGTIDNLWNTAVTITAGFPDADNSLKIKQTVIKANSNTFNITSNQ